MGLPAPIRRHAGGFGGRAGASFGEQSLSASASATAAESRKPCRSMYRKRCKRWWAPALLALLAARCGGQSVPTSPGALATPAPAIPTGTSLSVVSGETGQPVAGATVAVGGRSYQTDGSGRVALAEGVSLNVPVQIDSADFLTRHTLFRSAETTVFSLWPRTTASGLNEHYTASIVYTSASISAPSAVGELALTRLPPTTRQVVLVLSPETASESATEHQDACERMTAATGGQLLYAVAAERPTAPGVTVFDVRIDPQDEACAGAVRAQTRFSTRLGEIQGGTIIYCSRSIARSSTVAHELGHTFGLRHSPFPEELMYGGFSAFRARVFGPRELLVMSLMRGRRAGNRFPDYDREALGTLGGREEIVILCY